MNWLLQEEIDYVRELCACVVVQLLQVRSNRSSRHLFKQRTMHSIGTTYRTLPLQNSEIENSEFVIKE
jgi:hypothetical protein